MAQRQQQLSWVRGKRIGKGSFGIVNVAVNKLNGTVFAVKSVEFHGNLQNSNQLAFLENEIRILRSVSSSSSPYVVKYLGDDASRETPTASYRNLHMEYIPGGTLADVTTDVDERIVQSYTRCLVSALRYLHGRGIVHCDVKGRNVLVGPSLGLCKLADFGSAIEFSPSTCAPRIAPRGSPLWMAPEVIRGEYQGPESDVWSLGCTIIEMLNGGKPAWEDRGVDTLSRIGFSAELPEFPARLSELGCDFLEKCLRRDWTQRWSCDQLLQHPFLSSVSPVFFTESSPRCVLDWVNFEFEEEEEDDEIISNDCEVSAQGRISKLATSSGANWESDGWVAVRSYFCSQEEKEVARVNISSDERTSSAFADFTMTQSRDRYHEEETAGTSSVYSDLLWISEAIKEEEGRTKMEINKKFSGNQLHVICCPCGCCCEEGPTRQPVGLWCGACGAGGSSCRYGSLKVVELAVEKRPRGLTRLYLYTHFHKLYHHLLLLLFLLILRYYLTITILLLVIQIYISPFLCYLYFLGYILCLIKSNIYKKKKIKKNHNRN